MLLPEGKKHAKRIFKEYKIKNDLALVNKNLSFEQQNILSAVFVVDNCKIVSQFKPDGVDRYFFNL